MLIRDADVPGLGRIDLRIVGDRIVDIARAIHPTRDQFVIYANGGALLPGLHDHHLHLMSLAKSLDSVPCGPPEVRDATQLADRLRRAALAAAEGSWVRGIGYHESVAGELDRAWLDRVVSDRPLRIQHRSGRLWMLNSAAVASLAATPANDGDTEGGRDQGEIDLARGRFQDADAWLRARLPADLPPLARASALLAGHGVVGVTDTTPGNSAREYRHFVAERRRGHLRQEITVMGGPDLDQLGDLATSTGVDIGATKIHLHESALPDFDGLCDTIRSSHRAGRAVAVHCVTVAELFFALGAFREAGSQAGDRIEHASLTPPDALPILAELGLTVVTQPNFIFERGDQYRADIPLLEQPWLYRGRAFLDAGIPLAAGTDAPFGDANPWRAMAAAVDRLTCAGSPLGLDESLSPEQALSLFTGSARHPGGPSHSPAIGGIAHLCLLDRPWRDARAELSAVRVEATLVAGLPVHGPK